jgi:hypothetical protein
VFTFLVRFSRLLLSSSCTLGEAGMEAHLTECVQEALAAFQYRNATFLAERLHTSLPTEARVPELRERCGA